VWPTQEVVVLTISPPTNGLLFVATGLSVAGLAVLVHLRVTWAKPDSKYDRRPNGLLVSDAQWHGMRRTLLPNALAAVLIGPIVFLMKWWPNAALLIFVLIVAWFGIGFLSMWVGRTNRPQFLVRPALRDRPGSREERKLRRAQYDERRRMALRKGSSRTR
jgi:hypothetical protein